MRHFLLCFLTVTLLLFLAACKTNPPPENTSSENNNTSESSTLSVPPTAALAEPTKTNETAVSDQKPTCIPIQSIDLRSGPGTSFIPPLQTLSPDDTLIPLTFSAVGFPDGQWLEVEVAATNEEGWVGAGSTFVTCNINPTSLPPATNIPPTPTVEPTNTTQVVAQAGPPRITNNAPGGTKAEYVLDEVIVDDEFLFRIYIADTRFGDEDGAGIDHADFTILTQDESHVIYENREDHAAYCVFQGGLPDCNPWVEENGRFYWPNGIEVQSGSYHATILVYPQHPEFKDEVWNWDFDFWIDLP